MWWIPEKLPVAHLAQVDTYQRPLSDRSDIYQALKDGLVVPNIEIGVRGQDFTCEGDDYVIRSPAFIIDGWQRVGTALKIEQHANSQVRRTTHLKSVQALHLRLDGQHAPHAPRGNSRKIG